MSTATGGRFFEVSKKETIDKIYAAIDEELRNQYSLGYTPEKSDSPAGYHTLHLAAKQKDMTVQTRAGFYLWTVERKKILVVIQRFKYPNNTSG